MRLELPPSPVLSACDSLDGIDDLDAFLDQQGNLSHFPTPPLSQKQHNVTHSVEVRDDNDETDDDHDKDVDPDYEHIALILAQEASFQTAPTPTDIEDILRILISADLPLVVVALAFNILSGLRVRLSSAAGSSTSPADLSVLTALNLAVTCTYDSPHSARFWSLHVCHGRFSTARIEQSVMSVLACLDFRLHEYSLPDRLKRALVVLSPSTEVLSPAESPSSPEIQPRGGQDVQLATPEKNPLTLMTDYRAFSWVHGQVTPNETPEHRTAFPAGNRFLRLL